MTGVRFVEIQESDLLTLKEIYDYYILNSTSTYYTEKISIAELKDFIPVGNKKYPSFLILKDQEPVGFFYLSQYKKRQAYDRTAEVSVYLRHDHTGKGIGKEALKYLEKVAKANGIPVLLGIISADNARSIMLFEHCGYERCGYLKQIGEKFNNILDVAFYQKIIN